ncbi:MAG: hypothetical protein Q9174_000247 [Haloplaca sp. 1 TL-2023]
MSTAPATTAAPAAEPVTATAQDATVDPIRTNASQDLTPESRPEITEATPIPASETTVADVPKGEAVVESQPINEGVLAYKQPGLVKSLMYSKKFFWFSDEPVEHKHLTDYLRGEKATDVARPNAAHASQTGKGLLFFAKRAEDKPQPQGIINLADIHEVTKTGPSDFTFKYHGQKHAFQAVNPTERDGWLVALETRQAEAKSNRQGIVGSEGYKSSLEKFSKPGAVGASSTASRSLSRHKKPRDSSATPASAGVGGDSASSSDEAKTSNAKSRSQSRKRGSMFGALLGKKEQHDEKKEVKKEEKEAKKEDRAEEKAIKAETKKEDKAEKHDEKEQRKEENVLAKEEKKMAKSDGVVDPLPLDAAAVASRVMDEPIVPAEGTKAGESSIGAAEPTNGTTATATPTTETSATPVAREPTTKSNKRNSIFGNFFAKKDAATRTPETTSNETAPAVPAKDDEPAASSPVVPSKENDATDSAPVVDSAPASQTAQMMGAPDTATPTATSTSAISPDTKANRRSSFFSNLGTKKEKKTGGVSDAEGTDGEGKKSGGFGGLLRKASRAQGPRSASKPTPASDGAADTEAPAPISKDTPTEGTLTNGETTTGDVAPEPTTTTTTSQQTPVQASA